MRATLITLTLLLLAPEALASGYVWERTRVPVLDFTGDQYAGVVAETVTQFRAIMPRRGPSLRYKRRPETPCARAPRRRGTIVFCPVPDPPFGGETAYDAKRHVNESALVRVADVAMAREDAVGIVEHEMVHAVFGAGEGLANADLSRGGPVHRFAKRLYHKHGR